MRSHTFHKQCKRISWETRKPCGYPRLGIIAIYFLLYKAEFGLNANESRFSYMVGKLYLTHSFSTKSLQAKEEHLSLPSTSCALGLFLATSLRCSISSLYARMASTSSRTDLSSETYVHYILEDVKEKCYEVGVLQVFSHTYVSIMRPWTLAW